MGEERRGGERRGGERGEVSRTSCHDSASACPIGREDELSRRTWGNAVCRPQLPGPGWIQLACKHKEGERVRGMRMKGFRCDERQRCSERWLGCHRGGSEG
eukprot:758479-Hanusia_phi.AAC.2